MIYKYSIDLYWNVPSDTQRENRDTPSNILSMYHDHGLLQNQ